MRERKGGRRLGSVPDPCGSDPNAVRMAGRAAGGHASGYGLHECSASRCVTSPRSWSSDHRPQTSVSLSLSHHARLERLDDD